MTITKQDIHAALTHLAEAFPQTFVLERSRPHRPLKIGIAADLQARCPALEWRVLKVALAAYTGRVMYLRGLVAGAARIDLDGNPAGEVSAKDAKDTEYATVKLDEILAAREARKAAAVANQRRGTVGGGRGAFSRNGLEAEEKASATAGGVPPTVRGEHSVVLRA
jgi:ProP effector